MNLIIARLMFFIFIVISLLADFNSNVFLLSQIWLAASVVLSGIEESK